MALIRFPLNDHTKLINIGVNTHAEIDTALARLANTSGTNTGDQTLAGLGGVPTGRLVSTSAPLAGGGNLSADRTLSLGYSANLTVTGGNLDTVQGIQTTSTPQFVALGLGAAPAGHGVLVSDSPADPSSYYQSSLFLCAPTFTADNAVYVQTAAYELEIMTGGHNLTSYTNPQAAFYCRIQVSGAGTVTAATSFQTYGVNAGSGTVTTLTGVVINTAGNTGGGTIGTFAGMDIRDQTAATVNIGIRSMITSGTNKWNLYLSGSANSYLAGNLLLGTTTDGMTAGGSVAVAGDLAHRGSKAGFFNTAPATKPTVTGAKSGNAALGSLLTALAGLGLVTDSTT